MATHTSSTKQRLEVALADAGSAQDILSTLEGGKVITRTLGAAAAAVTDRWGSDSNDEGTEMRVIDETVVLTNASSINLTSVVPAGSVILSVQANLQALIAGDGSGDDLGVKVGIGISGTPSKYGFSADLNKNTKVDKLPGFTVLSGSEQISVNLVKTDGTASTEKFTGTGGSVRVRVVFLATNSLVDAA